MKTLRCVNQQWCRSNADVMAWQSRMHQPNEKWWHGNQRGCRPNRTTTARWQLIICQPNQVNGGATIDKWASHTIGYGTRTNEFVRQVEKWQQNKSAIQVRNGCVEYNNDAD
jgi:hypothetical protein